MLKTVAIKNLKPNPYRRLDEYEIIREKVDALKRSIAQTGFWPTIVGRPKGTDVEIAFGHHRLVALQEGASGNGHVEVVVEELSNELMLKMMANENMEEWGTSAWVEVETVRATIEAYGRGEIELPKVPRDTRKDQIRNVSHGTDSRSYTEGTVAQFLGWTRKQRGDALRPSYACQTAFQALEMLDKGFLHEADLRGLKRSQLADLVKEQWVIYHAEKQIADEEAEQAKKAEELARTATEERDRQKLEKRAKVHREQSEQHREAAKVKAIDFGKEAANLFRSDQGREKVKQKAAELKPIVEQPVKVHNINDLADRLAARLEHIAKGDDDVSADFALLKQNRMDLSDRAAKGLCQSFAALIERLERMHNTFSSTSRSH
jgi:hypothetical protein